MQISIKQIIYISITTGIISLLSFSCQKKEVYPLTPIIEFKDYSIIRRNGIDSNIVISFSFKDGDGDIGYSDDDKNMSVFVYYYKKKGGVFNLTVNPDSSNNFNVKLPMILPDGVKRPIKGDIDYLINIYYDLSLSKNDTVYVEFYLQDRALNKSNLIASPEIVLKKRL